MKFSVNNKDILRALSVVSRAIATKTTNPILECVHIKTENNTLNLKATNTEISVISEINCLTETPGEIVVNIKTFNEILRTYPDQLIHFNIDENKIININCGTDETKSNINILGKNAQEYPTITKYDTDNSFVIENDIFKNLIKDTIFACAGADGLSPILTGVQIKYEDNILKFVALDGFKLAIKCELIVSDTPAFECIVPSKTLSELHKILAIYEDDIHMNIIDNKLVINIADNQFISNLLDGKFVNYNSIIPKTINTMARVDRLELLNSLERASLITDSAKNSLIKMNLSDNSIQIISRSDIGKVVEDVAVDKNGDDIKIAFNSKYLIEILKIFSEDRIMIEYKDSKNPAMIKLIDTDKYLYLIMPVKYEE